MAKRKSSTQIIKELKAAADKDRADKLVKNPNKPPMTWPVPDWFYLPLKWLRDKGVISSKTVSYLCNLYRFKNPYLAKFSYGSHRMHLEILKKQYGAKCMFPGCRAKRNLTVDHIIPRSLGGSNAFYNKQILCYQHNHSKGSRSIMDYRPKKKR